MHSFEMLTKISGNPLWADRCEDFAFNSFPAAMTPDLKGLHYLTCANHVQFDKENKSPGFENGGTMFGYSPYEVYRCCQHNVSHGWPYYAEELWLATADRGLCASLYAATRSPPRSATAPRSPLPRHRLSLRRRRRVEADGAQGASVSPCTFGFHAGAATQPSDQRQGRGGRRRTAQLRADRAHLESGRHGVAAAAHDRRPADLAENQNAVSVDDGPLWFSLKIGETVGRAYRRAGQVALVGGLPHDGLELRPRAGRAGAGEFVRAGPPGVAAPGQPFTADAVPSS